MPETHDYTVRSWGHDYTFEAIGDGRSGRMMGWGHGLKDGDYLLLQNGDQSTRYIIDRVRYFADPSDMWRAQVTFAPRTTIPERVHHGV